MRDCYWLFFLQTCLLVIGLVIGVCCVGSRCSLCVACCLLFVVCWWLFVVVCLPVDELCVFVVCRLMVVRGSLLVVCVVLCVVWC